MPLFSPERQVQALLQRALRSHLKLVQGMCQGVGPLNWLPAGLWSCRYERGGERERGGKGQVMVLSLGEKAHVRASSGEAEGPEIAPCPVLAVGKGKREAGQEKEYERRSLALLAALRWAQVDVPAPKAPVRAGAQHSRTWLCMSPNPLSQAGKPWERSLSAPRASPQLPAMVQGLPRIRD